MITSILQGGLGNQLFQIAAAYALAEEYEDSCCFDFSECYTPNQGFESKKYLNTIYKNICNKKNSQVFEIYHELKFSYEKIPYKKNLILKGFFQSEKYFYNIKKKLRDIFDFSDFDKIEQKKNVTSVHIRRGDYINHKNYHTVLDHEYYEKAMSLFDTNFLFFSDDISWVKKNFKGEKILYSENNDELLDFVDMMNCENNIIANSSFSWWAAYLNNISNKKIVAPSKWFGPSGPKDISDLIPESWIKI